MKSNIRKTCALIAGVVGLLAAAVLAASVLKDYGHSVPVILGPYKQALFILLGLMLAAAAGFYFCPLNKRTVPGTLFTVFGVLWFTGRMILAYRSPESSVLPVMDRWMPLPLVFIGAGLALWAGELIPDTRKNPVLSEKWQQLLILLLIFICLQPVLSGGFAWDDAFFSVEAQVMRVTGEPIFARVWKEIVDYVRIGRINPFATFHFLEFYFIPDAFAYQLMLVLLTLLDGFLFYRFLRLWKMDAGIAAGALLVVPLCFQLRLYHDPLNSYYGLMQVMFCELMLALIFFIRFLREKKRKYLILSLIPFVMGLMTYEMFFPLTALFLIPALVHEKKPFPALRKVLPYILIAVLLFGLSMLLRMNITEETAYNGTTFSLDIGKILQTFSHQVGAAFPLRYRTAGYDTAMFGHYIPWYSIFNTSAGVFLRSIQWQDLLACFVFILVVFSIRRESLRFSGAAAVFAFLLWLLPGLVISLSWKYQEELCPGLAYIPVYFSYFGMALLLFEAVMLAGRLFRPQTLRLLLSGIGCAVLLITLQDNRRISSMLNDIFLYPRQTGEAALRAGILETDYPVLVSDVPFSLWEHGWQREPYQSRFYTLNAGHPVYAVGTLDFTKEYLDNDVNYISPSDTALITYSGSQSGGFAKFGRLRGTGFDAETGKLAEPLVSDLFFFVSGTKNDDAVLIYETKDRETKRLRLGEAWLIRETGQGTLYKLQENRPVFFDSVSILAY